LKPLSKQIFTAGELQSHPDLFLFVLASRIGAVPNLSLISPTQASAANNASRVGARPAEPVTTVPATVDGYGHTRNNSLGAFNTVPAGPSSAAKPPTTDEFGYGAGYTGRVDGFGTTKPTLSSNATGSVSAATAVPSQPTSTPSSSTSPGRRPGSASKSFIVTNPQVQEQWLSAEQEKLLYEQARARAAQVQRGAVASVRGTLAVKERIY